jgi:O-antigen/teichoic acid export membrane protein
MSAGAARFSRAHTLQSARWFLLGKVASAVATLAWLAWVTRTLMPQGGYDSYVAAIAYLETAIVLSLFGLDWLLIRHVPPCVSAGDGLGLRRLLRHALLARFFCAASFGAVALLIASCFSLPPVLQAIHPGLLLALLLSEALLRLLRDSALESMAAQGYTQLGVLGRTLLCLAGAGLWVGTGQSIDVNTVLALELGASLLMLICVAFWSRRVASQVGHGAQGVAPPLRKAWKACWHNYQSALINYPMQPQALVLMVSWFASSAVLEAFGLVMRLFELLRSYVPGLLLMNVLRPRLIGRYAAEGDFPKVAAEALWISRWSAISAAPVVGVLLLYGDSLMRWIAGNAPEGAHWALAALFATALLRLHRQIGQVLVNCVGATHLLTRMALVALLAWPLGVLLALAGWPIWGAVLALALDDLLWVLLTSFWLRRAGWLWPNGLGFMLGLLALAGFGALAVGQLNLLSGAAGIVLGSVLIVLVTLAPLALLGQLPIRSLVQVLRGSGK